jgi:hypothetical protein
MAEKSGFDGFFIKPYPPPDSISFSVKEYYRFIGGDNSTFPLNVIREDLKYNTNVILKKGAAVLDSKKPGVLRACLNQRDNDIRKVRSGESYSFRLEIENSGNTIWLAGPNSSGGFVTLGVHLYSVNAIVLEWDYGRGILSRDVYPGEKQDIGVSLVAPKEKGIYYLEFDLVCEGITWFAQQGSQTLRKKIEVI